MRNESMRVQRRLAAVLILLVAILMAAPGVAECATAMDTEAEAQRFSRHKRSDQVVTMPFGGRKRYCLVHTPRNLADKQATPLVVVLHGGGGDFGFASRMTCFSQKADEEGFVVAYPNGTGAFGKHLLTWNAGYCCGFARGNDVDDVGFVLKTIEQVSLMRNIDQRRIYLVGFSNGAMLAYKIAAQAPGRLAAVASVSGCMSGSEPKPVQSVPVVIIHGTADKHVPVGGGPGKLARWGFPINGKPLAYAVKFWREANGCTSESNTQVCRHVTKTSGEGGDGEVILYTIDGGGHAWPGGRRAWFAADEPFAGFDATASIWDFFKQHQRK